jgi:von Willebrand factor type A domain
MKNDFTYLAVVLDRSGSMLDCRHATITGFNELLSKQKSEPGEAKLYLAQFNQNYQLVYDRPLAEAEELNHSNYIPEGMTALYDAMGVTIENLGKKFANMPEAERPSKVLIAVITDGYENSSHDHDRQSIATLVKHQKEKYNWDFIYIGANQDAILEAAKVGITGNKALTYTVNNARGVVGQSVNSYLGAVRGACDPLAVAAMSFSDEERKAAVAP